MNYPTHKVLETIGARALSLRCLVDFEASVDQLFSELAPSATSRFEELCPYFGVLWPPARVLADYLARLGELVFAGKRVLELGCGLALPSLATAALGADVTASDWHPDVPEFLRQNVELNGLPAVAYRRADWYSDPHSLADLGFFDVIIGSDVLYDPRHPAGLSSIIQAHLAPHGTVFIADANRSYAATFAELMEEAGFDCQVKEKIVTGNLPRQSTAEILVKIYEFHRA